MYGSSNVFHAFKVFIWSSLVDYKCRKRMGLISHLSRIYHTMDTNYLLHSLLNGVCRLTLYPFPFVPVGVGSSVTEKKIWFIAHRGILICVCMYSYNLLAFIQCTLLKSSFTKGHQPSRALSKFGLRVCDSPKISIAGVKNQVCW